MSSAATLLVQANDLLVQARKIIQDDAEKIARLRLTLRRCLEAMDEGASREGVWLGMEDAYNAGYAALGEKVPGSPDQPNVE